MHVHYGNAKRPLWVLKLPFNRVFVQQFVQTDKKHERPALLSLCEGNLPVTDGFSAQMDTTKWTVTRKMFLFDDFIMLEIIAAHHK